MHVAMQGCRRPARPVWPDLQAGPRPERSGHTPKCMHLIRLIVMANKLIDMIIQSVTRLLIYACMHCAEVSYIWYHRPLLKAPANRDGCMWGCFQSYICRKGGLVIQCHNEVRDAIINCS